MRILVSGGNGFVGRTLCRKLIPQHEVCVVDNLRYGPKRFSTSELSSIRWENIDIRDRAAVESIVTDFRPEAIVHLAAIHYIPECEAKADLAISTNVLGTAILAASCPENCRFVFASSGAVYQPEDSPHCEQRSPVEPADVYGWTKLQGEQYVQYFAQKRNFPGCIVRLFNVIGPGETNPHLVPEIVCQLKAGQKSLKLGNLEAFRDYVHVDDVARGFASVATSGTIDSGQTTVVNLGTQQSYSVRQLLNHIRTISEIDFDIERDEARMRSSDRPFLAANITRIQQMFSWQPAFGIADSLADLWQNPDVPADWIERYR